MRRTLAVAVCGLAGGAVLLAQTGIPPPSTTGAAPAPTTGAEPAAAAVPSVRPTTKVFTCTTGGCHAKETDYKFVHGPTGVGACDACHEYVDPAQHTFKRKREGAQLCSFCHIDKSGGEGPVVHEPFAKGDCTGCHDPHGSVSPKMLKGATPGALCASCHKDAMKGSHAHKPAAENCASCHSPHSSSHAKLLSKEPRELCLSCHEDVGKSLASVAHPHKPAQGECTQCHTPHASDNPKMLKQSPSELCLSCHKEMRGVIEGAVHTHSAVGGELACLNCHAGHGSEHAKQLVKDEVGACLKCHAETQTSKDGRTIADAKELGVAAFHKHGPIQKGDCAGCHDVHGGKNASLLVTPYEKGFYQKYTDDSFKLCFTCHDRALVTATGPGAKTGFRDGERNLHAVHVSNAEQGRSCRACHTVHAGRNESMIADSVSFGGWSLPLGYTKSATGGTCASGCHKPQTYDRGPK